MAARISAMSNIGATTSSILSATKNAGLIAALNTIKIPNIGLTDAIPTSPNVHDSSIGLQTLSDMGKKAGSVSNVLQADAGSIVKAAENLPGVVTLAAGDTVKAITDAANTYSIGGRKIGDLVASNLGNAAVLAVGGVAATPGILVDTGWNIGTDLAAVVKGVPLGQVKKSNLGDQSLDVFLGGVKGLTGYEADKGLISREAESLARPSIESNNLFLQGGGWGLVLGGELINTTLINPTSVTGEVGLLQVAPVAFDFIGSVGNREPAVGQKAGGYKVNYIPTANPDCVGHVVGSKEAKAAGCA
jgi:hypothetical protein